MEKFENFESARESVQGTKVKLVTHYSKFLGSGLDREDLMSVADLAIWDAWNSWDSNRTKFNTHAHNRINWALMDELNKMNSTWKANKNTSYELSREDQTFAKIKESGITNDVEFNEKYGLDGSESAKRKFNRDMYNEFVGIQSKNRNQVSMMNETSFTTEDNENFSIFDVIGDNFDEEAFIKEIDVEKLPADKRKIAKMLMSEADIDEVAKEIGVSRVQLFKVYVTEPTKNGKRNLKAEAARNRIMKKIDKKFEKIERERAVAAAKEQMLKDINIATAKKLAETD